MSTTLDKALSPKEFCTLENCSLAHFYNLLSSGRLVAVKDGVKTKILPEEHRRYRASLPKMISRARPPASSRRSA